MLYSSVPDVSVCPNRNTDLVFCFSRHCAFPSNPKYTVDSGHAPSLLPAEPAFLQKPSTQSSSSAQSSSFVHFAAFLHAPASQLPPGPHSLSDAHALHLPA